MRSIWSLKWTAVARKVGESSAASLTTTGLENGSALPAVCMCISVVSLH
jgi:hypothetical protein